MNKNRLECERLIYKVFDILDPSGENTDFWKEEFSKMSDEQFKTYISKDFPFYYQSDAFKEPTMEQIANALDFIGVPLLEPIYMPCTYKDDQGRPMKTSECLVSVFSWSVLVLCALANLFAYTDLTSLFMSSDEYALSIAFAILDTTYCVNDEVYM